MGPVICCFLLILYLFSSCWKIKLVMVFASYNILSLNVSLCRTVRMSEKGSTSDVKNAMEGDGKRTRDQVGPENNVLVPSNTILHYYLV